MTPTPPLPDPETLLAYIEGELSAEDRAAMEQQLSAEPKLRQLVEGMAADRAVLQNLPEAAVPHGLDTPALASMERDALLGGLSDAPPPTLPTRPTAEHTRGPVLARLFLGGAIAASLLVVGVVVMMQMRNDQLSEFAQEFQPSDEILEQLEAERLSPKRKEPLARSAQREASAQEIAPPADDAKVSDGDLASNRPAGLAQASQAQERAQEGIAPLDSAPSAAEPAIPPAMSIGEDKTGVGALGLANGTGSSAMRTLAAGEFKASGDSPKTAGTVQPIVLPAPQSLAHDNSILVYAQNPAEALVELQRELQRNSLSVQDRRRGIGVEAPARSRMAALPSTPAIEDQSQAKRTEDSLPDASNLGDAAFSANTDQAIPSSGEDSEPVAVVPARLTRSPQEPATLWVRADRGTAQALALSLNAMPEQQLAVLNWVDEPKTVAMDLISDPTPPPASRDRLESTSTRGESEESTGQSMGSASVLPQASLSATRQTPSNRGMKSAANTPTYGRRAPTMLGSTTGPTEPAAPTPQWIAVQVLPIGPMHGQNQQAFQDAARPLSPTPSEPAASQPVAPASPATQPNSVSEDETIPPVARPASTNPDDD